MDWANGPAHWAPMGKETNPQHVPLGYWAAHGLQYYRAGLPISLVGQWASPWVMGYLMTLSHTHVHNSIIYKNPHKPNSSSSPFAKAHLINPKPQPIRLFLILSNSLSTPSLPLNQNCLQPFGSGWIGYVGWAFKF